MSGQYLYTISASGNTVRECYTVPVMIQTETGKCLKHTFLLFRFCLVNLLRQDLMCRLSIILTCSDTGLRKEQCEKVSMERLWASIYVPLYVNEWQITLDVVA